MDRPVAACAPSVVEIAIPEFICIMWVTRGPNHTWSPPRDVVRFGLEQPFIHPDYVTGLHDGFGWKDPGF